MIEFRSDGGDFAEIWVNGTKVMDLCNDDWEIETAEEVAKKMASGIGIGFVSDNNYEWVYNTGLIPAEDLGREDDYSEDFTDDDDEDEPEDEVTELS